MAVLLPNGKQSYIDAAGNPLVGGKIYTYAAGTNVPQATWQDAAQVAANTNPVILNSRGEATIFWLGAYKVILKDALDNIIWTLDNVATPDMSAGGLTFSATATYLDGTLGKHAQATVAVTDAPWLAKCDGVTNDAVADQAAITFVNSVAVPRILKFPDQSALTAGLNVDRAVDSTSAELTFEGGGLTTSAAITLVGSTLPVVGGNPSSEWTNWNSFRFACTSAATAAYAVSNALFRIDFDQCYFYRIKAVSALTPNYIQTWKMFNSQARQWQGDFIRAGQAFDFRLTQTTFEAGDGAVHIDRAYGSSLAFNLFENMTGPALRLDGATGFTKIGDYHEGISHPRDAILVDVPNGGASQGVAIIGNVHITGKAASPFTASITAGTMTVTAGTVAVGQPFSGTGVTPGTLVSAMVSAGVYTVQPSQTVASTVMTPTVAAITVGDTVGMSAGNSFSGNGFDITRTRIGRFLSIGDYSATALFTGGDFTANVGGFWEVTANGLTRQNNGLTAHAGGGQALALQLLKPHNTVPNIATTLDSVALPPTGDVDSSFAKMVSVSNTHATNTLNVYYSQFDINNFGATGRTTPWAIPPMQSAIFISGLAGQWTKVGA